MSTLHSPKTLRLPRFILTWTTCAALAVASIHPRPAQATLCGNEILFVISSIFLTGASGIGVAALTTDLVSSDAELVAYTGIPLLSVAGLLTLLGGAALTSSPDYSTRLCQSRREETRRANEAREVPASRQQLEASFATLFGAITPEALTPLFTRASCRGLGFEQNECPALLNVWREDAPYLAQYLREFFQSENEALVRIQHLSRRDRARLGQRFREFVENEISVHLNPGTVRILTAIGRVVLQQLAPASSSRSLSTNQVQIPLGDSPVYIAPNGVGIRF